jgi:CubicO group peptidase (beta-lactamase class C family)
VQNLLTVRNGYIVSEAYFLNSDKTDAASVQSVTKSILSSLIGVALSQGILDSLNQSMMGLFPEYTQPGMDPRKQQITLAHLLTMTAGYDKDRNVASQFGVGGNWVRTAIDLPLVSDPGEAFHYNGFAVHLLSAIITKVSGSTTLEYGKTWLFEKTGITVDEWIQDPQGIYYGGGGIFITAREMARFGLVYLNGGELWGRQILPSNWVQESLSVHWDGFGDYGSLTDIAYGYLWWMGTMGGHSVKLAWGFAGQFILLIPDASMIVVTQCTTPNTQEDADNQELAVLALIADHILPAIIE